MALKWTGQSAPSLVYTSVHILGCSQHSNVSSNHAAVRHVPRINIKHLTDDIMTWQHDKKSLLRLIKTWKQKLFSMSWGLYVLMSWCHMSNDIWHHGFSLIIATFHWLLRLCHMTAWHQTNTIAWQHIVMTAWHQNARMHVWQHEVWAFSVLTFEIY